jgi:hypothetical protein
MCIRKIQKSVRQFRMTADKILDLYLSEALKRRNKKPNSKQTQSRKLHDESLSKNDNYYKFI